MNPVSESRFLPSFLAIAASLVLVCGGLLLLTQTAPWMSRGDSGGEARAPLAADDAFEAAAPREITFAPSASAERQAATGVTEETDRGDTAQVAEAQPSVPQQAAPEPVQTVVSEPSPAQAEDTLAASDVTDVTEVDEAVASASEAIAAESMSVSDAEPISEYTAETSAVPETAPVNTGAVEAPVVAEASSAPSDQIGELLAEPAPEPVAAETISEDSGGAAGTAAEPNSDEITRGEALPAAPAVTAGAPLPLPPPPPPSPKRKPEIAAKTPAQAPRNAERPERPARAETPKQVQAKPVATQQAPKQVQAKPAVTQQPPKQAQAASAVAEQATGQPSSGPIAWLPMALAPADKPIAKQPAARLSGAAYSSKVWAALARNKPRAGQRGSATVTFTIGAGGALSGARIGKSSGNAKIDQLALATVRGAAPFPPPPSGPASFSIRIDFH